ncbi:MAG: mannose-1-phosphate guanylyltransferase [Spirochaetae bacterium HGW-Spirochaetae-8]|nr:MAG: mannose-1-phosphate guanylyltransferase [Spirochaetae bacterium HGW-Spirochaetae-8]
MHIILLSGGSGKRLWPLSNEIRSKQFLKVLKNDAGEPESMVQRVFRQLHAAGIDTNVVVAAGRSQEQSLRIQLGSSADLVLEPERRDTFPAIALSCAYLADTKHVPLDEVVVVLPVDVFADLEYFTTLLRMEQAVLNNAAELVLMGIAPDHPSEKFGYILPRAEQNGVYQVRGFVEKPVAVRAEGLLAEGAYWNGGVFAFRLGYLMAITAAQRTDCTFASMLAQYGTLRKISFDYEVVEKAASIAMVPYRGRWKDLGTWNTLASELGAGCLGKGLIAEPTGDNHIINELDIPIVALGTSDLVIVGSPDGILVSDREHSTSLKKHVDSFSAAPRYEEFLWGTARVVDSVPGTVFSGTIGADFRTRRLNIPAGRATGALVDTIANLVWVVVSGIGNLTMDDQESPIQSGTTVAIAKGQAHALVARTDLVVLEVQLPE